MTKGNSVPDYVGIGFQKIDHDLQFLIECLGEVLEELGLSGTRGASAVVREIQFSPGPRSRRFRFTSGSFYSIAFQLLNMVEENAAAYMRTLREASEGLDRRARLVGRELEEAQGRRRDGR